MKENLFELFHLSQKQIEKLTKFLELIDKWNKKMNLTGLKSKEEMLEELIIDSLMPTKLVEMRSYLLDAGCGAGIPSVPIKIAKPSLKILAVDSNRKKINFLRYCIRELNLENIQPLNKRIEDLIDYKSFFNTVTSKAFLPPNKAIPLLVPFLKEKGKLIIFASENTLNTALETAKRMNLNLEVKPYTLPLSMKKRYLIVIEKE